MKIRKKQIRNLKIEIQKLDEIIQKALLEEKFAFANRLTKIKNEKFNKLNIWLSTE